MSDNPEALRQECADFATSLRSAYNVAGLKGKAPPSFLRAADLFERAAAALAQPAATPTDAGLLAALEGLLAIHTEPAGYPGKFGKELDRFLDEQQKKIDAKVNAARAAIAAAHERQAATPAPAEQWPPALPGFIRRDVERAIEAALHPKGMSVHDGKARIGADRLQYLLRVIDGHAAPPATPAAQPAAQAGDALPPFNEDAVQKVYALLCSNEGPINPAEHWEGWVARRIVAALAARGQAGEREALALLGEVLAAQRFTRDSPQYLATMAKVREAYHRHLGVPT